MRTSSISITITLVLLASIDLAFAQKMLATLPEVQLQIRRSLRSPFFVDLPVDNDFLKVDNVGSLMIPNETIDHGEGVFGVKKVIIDVYSRDPIRYGVYSEPFVRVLNPEHGLVDELECHQNALNLLKQSFSWFFEQGGLPDPAVSGPSEKGNYNFVWQRYRPDELPDTSVNATVRMMDGKVTQFSSSKFGGLWEHKISPSQAKGIALSTAKKDQNKTNVAVTNWNVTGGGGERFYQIELRATLKSSNVAVVTGVQVNAMTGVVTSSMEGWENAEEVSNPYTNDANPIWTSQGLVFTSSRPLQKLDKLMPSHAQVISRDREGNVRYVTQDFEVVPSAIYASPKSSWIMMRRHGWTYAFNSKDGQHRVLGTPERPADTPTISSNGQWVVSVSMGRTGSSDFDLFADNLQRIPELALRARLVLPGGNEHDPIFSPDDKWLYFVTSKEDKGKATHLLRRMPAALARTKQMVRLRPEQVENLAALPDGVERLSIFPNGQKLLLQTPRSMAVVDVATRKVTPLKFPVLKDVELKGAAISKLQDAWAGPGNDEVTFSGETTDAAKKVRRRIYSCRFDGSSVRVWTPKENLPVPAYTFSQTKKTAYDLAKEMALAEIQWEQAHRD